MKFFFLILLWSLPLWGASNQLPESEKLVSGFDARRDLISEDYVAGAFLIYNCEKKHWVCVMEEFYQKCQEEREEDTHLGKVYARCAPVSEFPVKFSCYQEQLRLTSRVDASKLCVLDKWKSKQISFD